MAPSTVSLFIVITIQMTWGADASLIDRASSLTLPPAKTDPAQPRGMIHESMEEGAAAAAEESGVLHTLQAGPSAAADEPAGAADVREARPTAVNQIRTSLEEGAGTAVDEGRGLRTRKRRCLL